MCQPRSKAKNSFAAFDQASEDSERPPIVETLDFAPTADRPSGVDSMGLTDTLRAHSIIDQANEVSSQFLKSILSAIMAGRTAAGGGTARQLEFAAGWRPCVTPEALTAA